MRGCGEAEMRGCGEAEKRRCGDAKIRGPRLLGRQQVDSNVSISRLRVSPSPRRRLRPSSPLNRRIARTGRLVCVDVNRVRIRVDIEVVLAGGADAF